MFSLSVAAELESLRHVDLIRITAYENDGVLKISILYQNRFRDELVFWKEGTVECWCEVYENVGTLLERRKGPGIVGIYKTLHRYSQDFYVDVPEGYLNKGKWGIIECTVETGYKKIIATTDVSLGKLSATQKNQHFKMMREGGMSPEKVLREKYNIWKDEDGVVHVEEAR